MNALTIPAAQRRSGSIFGAKSLTSALRAVFSARVCAAVAILACAAMWLHILTVSDTLAAQRAVGLDALAALPWLAAWAIRATLSRKGGEL